ncbi:glycosyltransferase family 1 protein [Mycetocola lacteus]|uniref:Glycosyltransferase family 1 protein n=1 Tax=Mycetocola lacteus TaxID=76637 RepID=A0A3L7AIN0_9MICO|nr:glycosyltransferase family 1 protein [Mycetocola lacteus]RLP79825.1 glycosyltransferase family 1 protein [Mycetocola lacteus]
MANIFNAVGRSARLIADEGIKTYLGRVFAKASVMLIPQSPAGQMLVDLGDAAELDWTLPAPQLENPIVVEEGPINIAWIMSPPGRESGGHQNLFRFIDFAEKAGHKCTVYLYTTSDFGPNLRDTKAMLDQSDAYPNVKAEIKLYDRKVGVDAETQALFATGWETAYPAYLDKTHARRFYFVQDYEPSFYELGSQAILAENTYRFGFHGITAGGWLSHKLSTEYGMTCDSFDFAVNKKNYSLTNTGRRNEVFFYARPVTARRAFELGIMALADFHKLNPDVTINLAGWDVSNWDIPFPHKNLSSLKLSELNTVYNRCAAGLVLSLTNMSLLPLELLSSGVVAVVNDGANNRMVSDNPYIDYCEPVPGALARRLSEAVNREDAPEYAKTISASVANANWEDSGVQFNEALEKAMRG